MLFTEKSNMNVAVVSHFLKSPAEKTEVFWCPESFESLHTLRLITSLPRACTQLSLLVDAAPRNKGNERRGENFASGNTTA